MEQVIIDRLAAAREEAKQHAKLNGYPETLDAHVHLTHAIAIYVCNYENITEEIAAPLVEEFVPSAKHLCGYDHLTNTMYSILATMNNAMRAFPRLQLPVLKLLCENLSMIESESHHTLGIAEDAREELWKLSNQLE